MSTDKYTRKHATCDLTDTQKLACTLTIISAQVYVHDLRRLNVICQKMRIIMSSVSENKHTYKKLILLQTPIYSIPRSTELTFDQLFIDFFVSKRNEITMLISLRSYIDSLHERRQLHEF
jgi:hypothetical protein